MPKTKIQIEKSFVVLNAEKTFKYFNLVCHETIKELEEAYPRLNNIDQRTYVVPRQVCYHFTYSMNGKERHLKIIRKAGNSQTLETNIRTALTKVFESDLREMQFGSQTKTIEQGEK